MRKKHKTDRIITTLLTNAENYSHDSKINSDSLFTIMKPLLQGLLDEMLEGRPVASIQEMWSTTSVADSDLVVSMNIYAKEDDKVIYLDKHGYSADTINARKEGLVKGEIYTVSHVDVHQSCSDVYLKEFPKRSFNTVMFADLK